MSLKKGLKLYSEGCYADAYPHLLRAAKHKKPEAMYLLGVMFDENKGIYMDKEQAFGWYLSAASEGHVEAKRRVAEMYRLGIGTSIDEYKAYLFYTYAAEQGDAESQYQTGLYLHNGIPGQNGRVDKEAAFSWVQKSAEQGYVEAMNDLGYMYATGEGTARDEAQAYHWYLKAAEQGHALAQCNVGAKYAVGLGVEQNYTEAIQWFRKSAGQGNAGAELNLGIMYENGLGTQADQAEALKWYRLAAEQGNAQAQYNAAVILDQEEGELADYTEALKWYEKAAEQGNVDAQHCAAEMYRLGVGTSKNDNKSFKWYLAAAKQGDMDSQFYVGWDFDHGIGTKQNYAEAFQWYDRAAQQGDSGAMNHLGVMYKKGRGVEVNLEEAVNWYRKAAELGNAQSQYNLAYALANGQGVQQNEAEAVEWYRKSAEQGKASSMTNLGLMYEKGRGVEVDLEEAVNWYRKAAEANNAGGQFDLANMLENGRGVQQNYEEAMKWYTKAAEQENARAMNRLGLMYQKGIGCEIDNVQAMKWFLAGAEHGYSYSQFNAARLYDKLAKDETDLKNAFELYLLAAQQNHKNSQYYLALMYWRGKGTVKDVAKARNWMEKAADNGVEKAKDELPKIIEEQLSIQKLAEKAQLAQREKELLLLKQYKRDKDHVVIGTIGASGQGKTTLTAAITKVLAKRDKNNHEITVEQIDHAKEEQRLGISMNNAYVGYETANRRYTHIDCPGDPDFVKNMAAGMAQMDAAILVVSATDGIVQGTKESILLARQAGIAYMIVFLNKCDLVDDPELTDLVEMEVRECLDQLGYPGYDIPVIKGSALSILNNIERSSSYYDISYTEGINEFFNTIDSYFPPFAEKKEEPFFMPIAEVYESKGGLIAAGKVKRGKLKAGDEVEILGFNDKKKRASVVEIEMSHKTLDEAYGGDCVGVMLAGVEKKDIKRGQCLASPASMDTCKSFMAMVDVLRKDYGGARHTPFFNGYRPQLYCVTTNVTSTITLPEGKEMVMPGDKLILRVDLPCGIVIEKGSHFTLMDGRKIVASGEVIDPFEIVRKVLAEVFEIDPDQIHKNTRLIDDLGADSFYALQIFTSIEDECGTQIPDELLEGYDFSTVSNLVDLINRIV